MSIGNEARVPKPRRTDTLALTFAFPAYNRVIVGADGTLCWARLELRRGAGGRMSAANATEPSSHSPVTAIHIAHEFVMGELQMRLGLICLVAALVFVPALSAFAKDGLLTQPSNYSVEETLQRLES